MRDKKKISQETAAKETAKVEIKISSLKQTFIHISYFKYE